LFPKKFSSFVLAKKKKNFFLKLKISLCTRFIKGYPNLSIKVTLVVSKGNFSYAPRKEARKEKPLPVSINFLRIPL
jgi:hypothetical protein